MRYSFSVLLIFFRSLSLCSQNADTVNHFFTGFQAQYGFIIPHTSKVEPVSHTRPFGFELSFNRINTSEENWKKLNRYNISGIQIGYFNFQNPDILGSAFVCTIFTEPVISSGKKWIFSIKAGTGVSWQTRIYDSEKNPLNTFFSTRISFPLYLMTRVRYRFNENSCLTLSGSFNHISNGAVKVPNYGMNFPTILVGIEHFKKPVPRLARIYSADRIKKLSDQYLVIQTLAGYKSVYGEPVYAFGLHSRYTWRFRSHYALNAGAEVILDEGVKRLIKIENLELDYKRAAITAGQDFLFGRVVFTQYLGYYIYSPFKAKSKVYQKYELSWRILPEFMAGVYLRAHTSEAELAGLTFSYILNCR
jgi:hypothetical protein